jgi:two-component system chemotaxis response regulator CheB
MHRELPISVAAASDGAELRPGHVFIAFASDLHTVVEPGSPPKLRMVSRDPVEGARPSATLLFASIARSGIQAVGAVLSGLGQDGVKGLQMMRSAGCPTLAEDRATATFSETINAAIELGAVDNEMTIHLLGENIVSRCNAR